MDKKSPIHPLKGPSHLSPKQIADIVNSRFEERARDKLSQKYGVSAKRISNIWSEYYGGSTLAFAKSGLKKSLPTEPQETSKFNMRKIRTERGTYSAARPKVSEQDISKRAKSKRVILKPELLTDEDHEIIQGQLAAGNNSQELIHLMNDLVLSNKDLSKAAMKSVKMAARVASRNDNQIPIDFLRQQNTTDDNMSDSIYDDQETSYETESDSTVIKGPPQKKNIKSQSVKPQAKGRNPKPVEISIQNGKTNSKFKDYSQFRSTACQDSMEEYNPSDVCDGDDEVSSIDSELDSEYSGRSPRSDIKHQQLHRGSAIRTSFPSEFTDPISDPGYNEKVPIPKRIEPLSKGIQSSNSYSNSKLYNGSNKCQSVPSPVGDNSSQNCPKQPFHWVQSLRTNR